MVKMQKDSLLGVLLVMIILAHLISAFDWRWLRRPSEVFRQRDSVSRHGCDDDKEDPAQNNARSQETMTFHEFKKYRDNMRKERWTDPDLEEESDRNDERTTKAEAESESGAKQELWARLEIVSTNSRDESKASSDTPKENFMSELIQKVSYSNDELEKAKSLTEKSTPDESRNLQVKTEDTLTLGSSFRQDQEEDHTVEESLPSPYSPQGAAGDEASSFENLARSNNKTCAACSPVWYHVLTTIVPAAWLTNIVLVAWIFYGRDTQKNMRIPRGLVHKSSQTHQRSQLLSPLTATHEKGKRPHGNSPSTVITPLSRPRSGSPAHSVSPFNIHRRRSIESLPCSSEAYHKENVPEPRKNAQDRPKGDNVQAADASCLRPHIGDGLVRGQEQHESANIKEKSCDERVYKREYNEYHREGQMRRDNGEQNLRGRENDQSLKNRSNHPTLGHKTVCNGDTKSPSVEVNHGPTARGWTEGTICNLNLLDENVYIKPQVFKESQCDTSRETARGSDPHGSGKEKMAKGDFGKASVKNESETLFFDVATQKTSYFDVATQMSPLDIGKSPTGDSQSKRQSVTGKALGLTERHVAPDFVDRTTSPFEQPVRINPNGNVEKIFSEPVEITNTQFCEYGSTGDHCRGYKGGRDKLYAWQPYESSRSSPRGVTGIVNGEVYNAGSYEASSYAKPWSKGEDERSYQADSLIFEGESSMPPPPYGYHVRRHFSNPDSSTNVCQIMQYDSVRNEMETMDLLNSNDLFSSRKSFSSLETGKSTSSSSEVWQSLVNSQALPMAGVSSGREHPVARRMETERKKSPRKLMIIGKVNCGKRHTGKQGAKTQLGLTRGYEYDIVSKSNQATRERKRDAGRIVQAFPIVVKERKKTQEYDGRYIENLSPQTTKVSSLPCSLRSLDGGSKQFFKVVEFADKHSPHARRSARHPSALKINGGKDIKRVNLKRVSGDGRRSAKRITNSNLSHSCFNVDGQRNQNSPDHMHKFHSQTEKCELLPSYYMNLNSNAGISDPNGGKVAGVFNENTTETSSVEETQSTDQYFSTHEDSEIREASSDLDSNLSPSFTNDGDDVITVISLGKYEPGLGSSKSNDKLKVDGHGQTAEVQQQKAHTLNDSNRGFKKGQERANSEKSVDVSGENFSNRSTGSLITRDPHMNTINGGRHKRKAKSTEAGVLKQENSISKKTSATAGSKEWRKLTLNKSKQEKQKQQITAGDVHKAISGVVEKGHKNAVETQRIGKAGKACEAYNETFETKIKSKSNYESYLDYLAYKESTHRGRILNNTQGQGVRLAESDHHCNPLGVPTSTCSKGEDGSQIKRLVSLPETMPSQGSPKKTSLQAKYANKPDFVDTKSSVEVKSPITVSPGAYSATPLCSKSGSIPSLSIKLDVVSKWDTSKGTDSPKRDSTGSPKKEKSASPSKELINIQEKNEGIEKTSMEKSSISDNTGQTDLYRSNPETTLLVGSVNCAQSTDGQKENVSRTRESPIMKLVDTALKHRNTKTTTENGKCKTVENAAANDDRGESSNGKLCAPTNLRSKKKGSSYFKTHSRSPDGKRKRRNLKKIITEAEDLKPKKLKSVDKLPDKKRKKRKSKVKTVVDLEEETHTTVATGHLVYKSSSGTNQCNQVTGTSVCTVPTDIQLDAAASEPGLSLFVQSKRIKESRSASSTGRLISSGYVIHGFSKHRVFKYDEAKIRGQLSSSAETTSSMSGSNMPILSAESLLPFPAATAKTPSKAVQLVPCPKIRKNEKDLQEAELGWNSAFSSDDKGAMEKVKQNQKRAKVRYYIVKPKLQKADREVGVSRLKRPAPLVNHVDVEDIGSSSDIDLNSEVVPQERAKPGQGKSVQFSDNIEDLEASKEETTIERALRKPDSDSILHHAITKAAIESIKTPGKAAELEIAATGKGLPLKKEEQRSPVMPQRKRRPVWLKKSAKDKTVAVKPSDAAKSAAVGVPVKKLHSSDNMLKASSRANIHFYYPKKATVGSPKLSNTSLTDKRKVTYKAWINSIFMAAPMNKATKKLVAKSGSPVDIKEIVEGSSVDAADHFKISKPLHDGDVRSARSVPSLAPTKTGGVEVISGKKQKSSDDSRLVSQKKQKHLESWSPRSQSAAQPKEPQITAIKGCLSDVDGPTSRLSSSNVDFVAAFKHKNGMVRVGDHANRRRKVKKGGKKALGENSAKWQALASHDSQSVSDMERVHYCGDMMELNVLNMGLSWMVQSVFNRLPFLNQRPQDSTPICTRDLAPDQQLVE